jgi:1-acyl-sn-glycerol-3-phosphate acyltransferase
MYILVKAIIAILFGWARLLYGMRIEGEENIPAQGPFILSCNEISHMGTMMTTVFLARHILSHNMATPVGFGDEYMWSQGWSRIYNRGGARPILPHGRGQGTSGVLRALNALQEGRVVTMNPEGEMSWDGTPVPLKKAVGWLALRSGAPVVLIMATKGSYDVRPRWAQRPQLRGRFALRVSKPFSLTDKPQHTVTDGMIDEANRKIRHEMDELIYH